MKSAMQRNKKQNGFIAILSMLIVVVIIAFLVAYFLTGNSKPGSSSSGRGTISGTVTIGPLCPVEQIDHPCLPTPQTFENAKVLITSVASGANKEVSLDSSGHYTTDLPSGSYLVIVSGVGIPGTGVPKQVSVGAGQTATLDLNVDTGMR